jgi:hypothetical protein
MPSKPISTVSSFTLSPASIAAAQANGLDLVSHLRTLRPKADDLLAGLKAFAAALPSGDANAEIVADLIAALA